MPLGLKDAVTKQSDLAVVWRDPESYLGQDPLGKSILLYSTEGLHLFGTFSTYLGTCKSALNGRAWDTEFLGKAPQGPLALVVFVDKISDILL